MHEADRTSHESRWSKTEYMEFKRRVDERQTVENLKVGSYKLKKVATITQVNNMEIEIVKKI